ncbi:MULTISPECIES: hypothetical protein [unclassified Streptomyces]|uniref:hypothetical protein n=1 Tax=unclassified Streptomyces TaxID=2593676 RepID=UPI002E2604BE|nr:hypothetical protein OG296_41275 [Streptomyces sp. NBC_01001]
MNSLDGASAPTSGMRFGMAHAFVINAFLGAAVLLSVVAHMPVQDILVLLGGAGAVGVAVLVASTVKGGKSGQAGLLRRLLTAAFGSPGNGGLD